MHDALASWDGAENYGPHHIAQRLITLTDGGAHRDLLEGLVTKMTEVLERGRFRYSPYVLGQVLEAVATVQADHPVLPRLRAALIDFLSHTRLDSANFLNICFAVQGLTAANTPDARTTCRMSVASLFSNTCFRDNGSWYHSPMETAVALLTLHQYSHELVLVAPYSEVQYQYDAAMEEIADSFSEARRKYEQRILSNTVAGILWSAAVTFFVTYSTLEPAMPEWSKWALGAIIPPLLIVNLHTMLSCVRRDAPSDRGR